MKAFRAIAFLLGSCLIFSPLPSGAEQKQEFSTEVEAAKRAGVPQALLSRLLTLGYEYGVKAEDMSRIVQETRKAKEEDLPLEPLVSKVEEGLAKRVNPRVITGVIVRDIDQYRFARDVLQKALARWGIKEESPRNQDLARLGKTLSMGISKKELEDFFNESPKAPIKEMVDSVEFFAALKQSDIRAEVAEEIVFSGIKTGFFSKTAWNLPLVVKEAKIQKVSDEKIHQVLKEVVTGNKGVREAQTELGLKPDGISQSPQFSVPRKGLSVEEQGIHPGLGRPGSDAGGNEGPGDSSGAGGGTSGGGGPGGAGEGTGGAGGQNGGSAGTGSGGGTSGSGGAPGESGGGPGPGGPGSGGPGSGSGAGNL